MRKFLLTSAALLGMATTATAADLYVAPAPVPAPIDNFSGFYGGVHGGWGFGDAPSAYNDNGFNEPNCGPNSFVGCAVDLDPEGGFVGFQGGYNFLLGNGFMLGLEGDYSFASLHDSGVGLFNFGGGSATEVNFDVDRMASIRGRLGMDLGQMMPFITAGYGWMRGNRSAFNPDTLCGVGGPDCKVEATEWHGGFVVGGGLEYAITPNWRLKGEYRYWDGSKETYGSTAFADGTNVDLSVHTVQFGVNYGF